MNHEQPQHGARKDATPGAAPRRLSPLVIVVLIGLLALHLALGTTAWATKSPTCDEPSHLTAGYSNWVRRDFRLIPEHPPLAHLWAAAPLLFMNAPFPAADDPAWRKSDVLTVARQFLYESDSDADRFILAGRMMIGVGSAALGLSIFLIARSLFGVAAALFSTTMYALSPGFLAHGFLVTTDLAAALFFLLATWTAWRAYADLSVTKSLWSGLALGGLMASKMTAVIFVPIGALLLIARALNVILPTPPDAGGALPSCRRAKFKALVRTAVIQIAVAVAVIWATYGFRYSAMKQPSAGLDRFAVAAAGNSPGLDTSWTFTLNRLPARTARVIALARDYRLLPEAYLYGLAYTGDMTALRDAFFNGRRSVSGFVAFFPFCLIAKSTGAELAAIVLALTLVILQLCRASRFSLTWLASAPAALLLLAVVYFAIAMAGGFNIGSRHILPVYPPLIILAGGFIPWAYRSGSGMAAPQRRSRRAVAGIAAIILLAQGAAAFGAWPDYLAYFNRLVGEPAHAYRKLVDSSLDWGQDLKVLARKLSDTTAENNGEVYLSFLGNTPPDYYGIRAKLLFHETASPVEDPFPLKPGFYCISATRLQQVQLVPESSWTRELENLYHAAHPLVQSLQGASTREADEGPGAAEEPIVRRLCFARLCALLKQREPDDRAGGSILIYRVTPDELDRALFGPPPEIAEDSASGLCILAGMYHGAGAAETAIRCYRRSLEIDPNLARAHQELAVALLHARDEIDAMDHANKAIRLDPAAADAHDVRATHFTRIGRPLDAVAAFKKFVQLRPFSPVGRARLADLFAQQGDLAEAEEQYQEAISLRPAWASPRNNYAILLAHLGRLDEAVAQLREAERLRPDDAAIQVNLARYLHEAGLADDAAVHARKAEALMARQENPLPEPHPTPTTQPPP